MTRPGTPPPSAFAQLTPQPADPLLALIGAYAADPRADKLDLGVGVYRDDAGATTVMDAVKDAELDLALFQDSKAYLGPEGDAAFVALLEPLVFGASAPDDCVGIQTPGGTGALRLGFDLIARSGRSPTVWVGRPAWPNHEPIITAAGLQARAVPIFAAATQTLDVDALLAALRQALPGDTVLLQACCHNPTGADPTPAEWAELAGALASRGLLPFIDLAYHGLGAGLEADRAGLCRLLKEVPQALVAYSCDKNFALYRERTGALFVVTGSAAEAAVVQGNLLTLARSNWSMPPDHGAAIVRTILENPLLTKKWEDELDTMRARLRGLRRALATAEPRLAALGEHNGFFALLPLAGEAVAQLRASHGIYMPASGRINVAGLSRATLGAFVAAIAPHLAADRA